MLIVWCTSQHHLHTFIFYLSASYAMWSRYCLQPCLSVCLSVCVSACLCVHKKTKDYWSEIDVAWCEYVLWWTLDVVRFWQYLALTFGPESCSFIQRYFDLTSPVWVIATRHAASAVRPYSLTPGCRVSPGRTQHIFSTVNMVLLSVIVVIVEIITLMMMTAIVSKCYLLQYPGMHWIYGL